MELIEMKSLREVSLLYELSDKLDCFLAKWSIELQLYAYLAVKDLCEVLNEFHCKYPYGLT